MIISNKNRLAIYKGLSILENRKKERIKKAMIKEKDYRDEIEKQITDIIKQRREIKQIQMDKDQLNRETSVFKDLLNII